MAKTPAKKSAKKTPKMKKLSTAAIKKLRGGFSKPGKVVPKPVKPPTKPGFSPGPKGPKGSGAARGAGGQGSNL